MQPVLRLIPDCAVRPVDHRIGDLLTTVRRKAVQHSDIRFGQRQQVGVHLVRPERADPVQTVVLLAHRCPGIGDQDVGSPGRGLRIGGGVHGRAGLGRAPGGGREDVRVRGEAGRSGDGDVHTGGHAAQHERMRHVVGAVAQVGQSEPAQSALLLVECLQVGEHLAGMKLVGQCVDYRNRCRRGHFDEALLAEGTPYDRLDVAGQYPRSVGQGLLPAQLGRAAVDDHRMPAEVGDAHFEGEPRAGRVLVEDDRHSPRSLQWAAAERSLLEFGCQRQHLGLLGGGQVVVAKEMTDGHGVVS